MSDTDWAAVDRLWHEEALAARRAHRADRTAELRLARSPAICPACGRAFTRGRADQVTCSNACRQRAYRGRVTATRMIGSADGDLHVAVTERG